MRLIYYNYSVSVCIGVLWYLLHFAVHSLVMAVVVLVLNRLKNNTVICGYLYLLQKQVPSQFIHK